MKDLTIEWIQKAEGDFQTASREFRVRKDPNYDAVCFHAQQCAEKYLKARLQESDIPFGKTHDLAVLLGLLLPLEPSWEVLRIPLIRLSSYAVEFRYPGEIADKDLALDALNICKQVRKAVRLSLGLPT